MTLPDNVFMQIAILISKQSKCISKQVGAILVKDNRIISMGYNGTPSGFINCDEHFNQIERYILQNNLRSQHHGWSNIHQIHAQMNAILFAVKNGISIQDTTLFVTIFPCQHCLKNIVQSGISKIVYKEQYDLGKYNKKFMDFLKNKIIIQKF